MARRQKYNSRKIKSALYGLSVRNGQPVQLCQISSNTFDPGTGENVQTEVSHDIKLAITWSVVEQVRFAYDIGYLAANKNFTYGGEYQIGDRHLVIAGPFLPNDFDWTVEDTFFVVDDEKFKVIKADVYDNNAGVYCFLRRAKGDRPTFTRLFIDTVSVTDEFSS